MRFARYFLGFRPLLHVRLGFPVVPPFSISSTPYVRCEELAMTDNFMERDKDPRNNFGPIRLALAISVVASHSYFILGDAMAEREMLRRLTGDQMNLGELAVNAFFVISGYLVALSWLRAPDLKVFIVKRVLRIYPAFIVASIFSLAVIAPLAGAHLATMVHPIEIGKSLLRLVALALPKANMAFQDQPVQALNSPLWTIRYEFLCYLLVPLLLVKGGALGRRGLLVLYLVMLTILTVQGDPRAEIRIPIVGSPDHYPRFLTYFFGGIAFALNRDLIPFRTWLFVLCVALLTATAYCGAFDIAVATAGTYSLLFLAYARGMPLRRFWDNTDLSYATYLYGWPIQMLIAAQLSDAHGPWSIFAIALPITLGLAACSWFLVEHPCLKKKPRVVHEADGRTVTVLRRAYSKYF
jgi:peptidoglycan/LPS O-acetylase OafA/YrhL